MSSPAAFDYQILDLSGRIYETGTLINGNNQLFTSKLSKGMYLVRFSNGGQVFTEKFLKQ
ncbi:MAG: T9SS type A sorting domain-containing protein [Flavisolibacter sp.]|nr:T9SS type A sorting domain-containing protein [Flavisolibacter sp.]